MIHYLLLLTVTLAVAVWIIVALARTVLGQDELVEAQRNRIADLETVTNLQQEQLEHLNSLTTDQATLISGLERFTEVQALGYVMARVPKMDRPWALGRREKLTLN